MCEGSVVRIRAVSQELLLFAQTGYGPRGRHISGPVEWLTHARLTDHKTHEAEVRIWQQDSYLVSGKLKLPTREDLDVSIHDPAGQVSLIRMSINKALQNSVDTKRGV